MRIRLTRKLADIIDGVAISDYAVGDIIDLDPKEARLLLAERWAVSMNDAPARRSSIGGASSSLRKNRLTSTERTGSLAPWAPANRRRAIRPATRPPS
jgi:hypothetical protein